MTSDLSRADTIAEVSLVRAFVVSVLVAAASSCTFLVESDDLIRGLPPGTDASVADAAREAGIDNITTSAACSAPKTFCDDFEGASNVPWQPVATGNATVVVDGTKPNGGQKSLHASRAAAPGRESAKYLLPLPGRLRSCEVDVYATSSGPSTSLSFLKYGFDAAQPPFTSYQVSLQIGGGISEFGPRTSEPTLYHDRYVPELAFGRWVHIAIAIESDGSAATLKVDGNTVVDRFALASATGANPYVVLGMDYQSTPDSGWEVFVDNVLCVSE